MSSLITKLRINKAYPFVGRAAGRSIVGSLNFTISSLIASDVRKKLQGVPVEEQVDLTPLMAKYGNTLDNRNEIDEASRGAAHEQAMREEQGLAYRQDPIELAARLKVLRDAVADDLEDNAVKLRNPFDPKGSTYNDPFTVAPSLEQSFQRQIEMQPRVNEAQIRAQAEALGLPYEDCLRVTKARQEAGVRFLKAHKDEILSHLMTLSATGADGHALSTADYEDVELTLAPIHRARLYVSADRGLWYERDRAIGLYMRGHPDGAGNIKIIDGVRTEIHAEFDRLMRMDDFKRGIEDAVQRGATWPVLLDLVVMAKPATKAA